MLVTVLVVVIYTIRVNKKLAFVCLVGTHVSVFSVFLMITRARISMTCHIFILASFYMSN